MNWVQSFEIISKILKFLDYKIGSLILISQGQKLVSKGNQMNHGPCTTKDNMEQGSKDGLWCGRRWTQSLENFLIKLDNRIWTFHYYTEVFWDVVLFIKIMLELLAIRFDI